MNNIGQSAGKNLAWLCGFLEGDGTVTLDKQRMSKTRIIYTPKVGFTNTDYSIIQKVMEVLKSLEVGNYVTEKKTKNGIAFSVYVKGFKRVEKLLPNLIENTFGKKHQQALLLQEWIESRKQTGNNNTYTERELEIFEQLKSLKKPDYPQRLHAEPLMGEDIVRAI